MNKCKICGKEEKYLVRSMCKMCYNKWLLSNNPIYANNKKGYDRQWAKQQYKKKPYRSMTNEEKKVFDEKQRLWRKKNPEKIRQYGKRSYKKVSDRIKGRQEYLKGLPVDKLIQLIEQEEKFKCKQNDDNQRHIFHRRIIHAQRSN